MTKSERHKARSKAYNQLEKALGMMIESLEVLSQHRTAECETVDAEKGITLLFQDVALLKDFRQPIEQADEPTHTEDCPSLTECRKPFHTQHHPEWRIQKSYTAKDSIFQLNISLSHGVIEAPTGHEFRT